jgi:hypothetical protein
MRLFRRKTGSLNQSWQFYEKLKQDGIQWIYLDRLKQKIDGIMYIQHHPKPLCAAEVSPQIAVQLGEDCLSTWPRSGSYEFRSPAICWLTRVRHLQGGAANRGRLLFGYFFLATQEKVTSRRSATGNSQK